MRQLKLIKSVIVLIFLFPILGEARQSQNIPYYGDDFYQDLKAGASNIQLRERLKSIFNSVHQVRANGNDVIAPKNCKGECYQHSPTGYTAARVFLMGNFYLVKNGKEYSVHDVYCDKDLSRQDFKGAPPAPGRIPDNRVINVEHTWPQSRFTKRYSDEMQKSDLHHLFPTDSQLNSIRGNNIFGEVTQDLIDLKCPASRFGVGSAGSEEVFEPPQDHKGNVARALFYFAVRYELPIDQKEEVILRKWHREDPIDQEELVRNEEIFKVQKTRNPFIDFPELVEKIANF